MSSKTVRDVTCETCGKDFVGHITDRECEGCVAEKADVPGETVPISNGADAEAPVEAPEEVSEQAGEGESTEEDARPDLSQPELTGDEERAAKYVRRIEPEKGREAYKGGDRDRAKYEKARRRAARQSTETKKDKIAKDPLRRRLVELEAEKKHVQTRRGEIDAEISDVRAELNAVAQKGKVQKICYGKFRVADHECLTICPLRIECKVESGLDPIVVEDDD